MTTSRVLLTAQPTTKSVYTRPTASGFKPTTKNGVVLTVHYYANPADYEAQKSIAMNYLMTRHGAR
jgi:hypothetical protein